MVSNFSFKICLITPCSSTFSAVCLSSSLFLILSFILYLIYYFQKVFLHRKSMHLQNALNRIPTFFPRIKISTSKDCAMDEKRTTQKKRNVTRTDVEKPLVSRFQIERRQLCPFLRVNRVRVYKTEIHSGEVKEISVFWWTERQKEKKEGSW